LLLSERIVVPDKLKKVFTTPRGAVRFRGAFGGRGSGKSFNFADLAGIWGYKETLRILCTRDLQVSIKESFHAEVKNAIAKRPWLANHYDVGMDYIRGRNGTEFIFRGLRHNMSSIKSMAQIDLCIVEEAEDVPESSWRDLIPTIRAPKSEIWPIWNPRTENSPVDTRFRKNKDDDMLIVSMNYSDNPFFPDVLNAERMRDQRNLDPSIYAHIWEGAYLEISDAQVLRGKYRIAEFEARDHWDGPYFGADWGFSVDPTTLVKSWIYENVLYIEHEAYGVGVEIDHTPALFREVPGSDSHVIRADSARPETISYMRRAGFNIRGAEKGKGSVEDGVAFLRRFDQIIIHPRCKNAINEARLWSYKVDRLSGDVLPVLAPGNDHVFDGLRYALEPIMKKGNASTNITTPQQHALNRSW
jgi:phage terminase large subunit